jgi:hypothetical protein
MEATGTTGLALRFAVAGIVMLTGFRMLPGSGARPPAAPVGFTPRPVPLPQRMAPRLHEHFGAGTSSNWAGYAMTGTDFTHVKASWTVPAATATNTKGKSYSATWTGLDGDTSSTVEQLGTESDTGKSGRPIYYAWYEMYPYPGYYITLPNDGRVEPGDPITAEVKYTGNDQFFLSIVDGSPAHGWNFSTVQQLAGAQRTSANWITEAPSSRSVLPLADFGVVGYSDCKAATGGSATFQLLDQWIATGQPYDEITMVNARGANKATPSAVSTTTDGFTITWHRSQ